MNCHECLRDLAALPDVRSGAMSAAVQKHLAGCPACSSRLAALRLVLDGGSLSVEPPAGLAQEVLARHAPRRNRLMYPVLRWAAIAAAAAVVVIVAAQVLSHQPAGQAQSSANVTVRLTLDAPAAAAVAVVGDWNDWNPTAHPMKRRDGKWEIVLELQRGRSYQYQFLVNGDTWIPDPNGLIKVENGFGGMNSLLES